MSNLALLKVLCGGMATAGTVGVGSFLISDTSSEDPLATKKVKFEVQEQPEELETEEPQDTVSEELSTDEGQLPEESETVTEVIPEPPAPVIPKCTLYVVREPKGNDRNRVVTEILEKVEEEQSRWLKDKGKKFGEDVNKACPADIRDPKNIYVWKSTRGGWIYAGDISTQDWLLKPEVKVPQGWKVNSEGTAA